MNVIVKNIPNSITCLNILSGCVAVVFAFSPLAQFGPLAGWQCACMAIAFAAVFDFLDGFMARLLGAYSELGKQLDSLSDLVSFGVAPGMMILNLIKAYGIAAPWAAWVALLLPVFAAIRLGKFNIDTRQTVNFIGLPVPANAIFWIGYAALAAMIPAAMATWIVIPLIVIFAWLMVSPIRMFSLKFKNVKWSGNQFRWIIIAAAIVLFCIFGLPALSLIILLYIILSLIFSATAKD